MPAASYQRQGSFTFVEHQHPWMLTRAAHCSCKQNDTEIQIHGQTPALATGKGPAKVTKAALEKGPNPQCHPLGALMATQPLLSLPSTACVIPRPLCGFHLTLSVPHSSLVLEPSPGLGSNRDRDTEQLIPFLPWAVLHRERTQPMPVIPQGSQGGSKPMPHRCRPSGSCAAEPGACRMEMAAWEDQTLQTLLSEAPVWAEGKSVSAGGWRALPARLSEPSHEQCLQGL